MYFKVTSSRSPFTFQGWGSINRLGSYLILARAEKFSFHKMGKGSHLPRKVSGDWLTSVWAAFFQNLVFDSGWGTKVFDMLRRRWLVPAPAR